MRTYDLKPRVQLSMVVSFLFKVIHTCSNGTPRHPIRYVRIFVCCFVMQSRSHEDHKSGDQATSDPFRPRQRIGMPTAIGECRIPDVSA